MFESFKNSKNEKKPRDPKVNRAAIFTFVGLILALGIIVVSGIVANRSKKNENPPINNDPITQKPDNNDQNKPDDTPDEPDKPDEPDVPDTPKEPEKNDEQVENKLPSFVLPVSGALGAKHDSTLQVFSPTMNDYRVHVGIDITTEESAPVYAAADGKISKIWDDPMMGKCIAIEHSGDCYTIYKNLSETLPEGITVGTKVRSGQLVASVGDTAMIEIAEEPHLHFEMTVADLAVNPLEYFDEKTLESLSLDASFEKGN